MQRPPDSIPAGALVSSPRYLAGMIPGPAAATRSGQPPQTNDSDRVGHHTAPLAAIEFPAVLDLVAACAVGPLAAAELRARHPRTDADWIATELGLVGEVLAALRRGERLEVPPVPPLRSALGRLRVEGSVLDLDDLAAVQLTLRAGRTLLTEMQRLAPTCPSLAVRMVPAVDRRIEAGLDRAIGEDGRLLDSASPGLAAARREVHASRQRLIRRLETMLRDLDPAAVPGGATVTMRDGRYVIPVRRDARARPEGIIHDESGAGATLFLEPSAAIELGNAMREAILREEREVLAVLRALTAMLQPEREALAALHAMAVLVDTIVARARWALAMDGEVPTLSGPGGALQMHQVRHPLLLARGVAVVPFDLTLDGPERTLLISGPNTGGKTVLLKAAALAMALTQAGIVPPIGAESSLPIIHDWFVDIGDHQSLAANLSTFSAHVAALRDMLARANAATLVILDEVGSGTDPSEGGALAMAVLEALTQRGTLTLATTHLGALKDLAMRVPGVVNGSLQFDAETLSPTYRFTKGIPGRSYGLAIARRLGIDSAILAEAERLVPEAERQLDRLLARVEARGQQLQAAQADLLERSVEVERREAVAAATERDLAAREAEWQRREREAERDRTRQAKAYLMEARKRVEEALAVARGAADDALAREARRLVEEGIRATQEAEADAATVTATTSDATVGVGDRVRLPTGAVGELVERRGDGKGVVLVGAMRLVVRLRELVLVAAAGTTPAPKKAIPLGDGPTTDAAWEIDLRGMRADEAESLVWSSLDGAVLADQPQLRIIHGMGTGVLRDAVRRLLTADRRVASFDFAARNQGGTGVTIAVLR